MRPRLPRHQRSTVNAIGKIRDPVLGKKITACGMGRMPQAVPPLTVRKGSGPSPSFAPAVAPMRLASLTHPFKVATRQSAWLARRDLLFPMPYRRGGRSLGGRARLLEAVAAIDVGVA